MELRKLTQVIIASSLVSFLASPAMADDPAPAAIEFSGYIDVYSQHSPQGHMPAPPNTGPSYLEGRAFDALNDQVVLNMVELSAKRKVDEVTFRLDLAFGEMVDVLAGSGTMTDGRPSPTNFWESTRNITQAFLAYTPKQLPNLTVMAGKFYAMLGFETTKAKDNWQYSRSLSFNYAIPYWHEGLSVQYAWVPDKFSSTIQLLNAWDGRTSAETNKSPTLCLNLNTTPATGLTANYNFISGIETGAADSRRQVHEVNISYAILPEVSVAADYVLGSQEHAIAADQSRANWNSVAFYAKYSPTSWYVFSPRYEIFDDSDKGFALSGYSNTGGLRQKIQALTVANNFAISEGLEARLEFRQDKSNKDSFFKDKAGQGINHQDSYTLALLYSF